MRLNLCRQQFLSLNSAEPFRLFRVSPRLFHRNLSTHPEFNNRQGVPLDYITLRPKQESNRSPVLIFHGLFGNKQNWKSLGRQLAIETQRVVYSFDLRNHGDSPHVAGSESDLKAMAADINWFLEENNLEKAVLVGHSLGGRAVLQFAFQTPDGVEKLVAADISPTRLPPPAFYLTTDFTEKLSAAVESLPKGLSVSQARQKIDSSLRKTIPDPFVRGFFLMSLDKAEDGEVKWKYNLEALGEVISRKYLYKMQIPGPFEGKALLIHGSKSEYVRKEDYEEIQEVMPNARFHCVDGADHFLHIEKPKEVLQALVEFINE